MSSSKTIKKQESTGPVTGAAAILQACVRPCLGVAEVVIPFLIVHVARLHRLFLRLPQNAIMFVYGFVFCFFGGTFPTLFSAIQAAC